MNKYIFLIEAVPIIATTTVNKGFSQNEYSFGYEYLLNFTCLTINFLKCHYTSDAVSLEKLSKRG